LTDREIIARILRGDREGYGVLVRRYQQDAYRMSLALLGNGADAEDAASEALTKALAALPRAGPETNFKSWLLKITCNCCQDMLRRRGRERNLVPLEQAGEAAGGESPLKWVLEEEEKRQLWAALNRLGEEDRAALVMKFYQGMSYRDLAGALNWPEGTVASRLYRAREKLRQAMAGGESSGG
jgi:RNA polymerase sigma-70 factor (ECF subfamily)